MAITYGTAYTFDRYGWFLAAIPEQQAMTNWTPVAPPASGLATGQQWQWNPVAKTWSAQTYTAPPPTGPVTPRPVAITPLQFVELIQTTAGITDASLQTLLSNGTLTVLWAKLQLATTILPGDSLTTYALGGLVTANVITAAQQTAVVAAWPTA